jgi:hypothetical protein
MWKEDLMNPTYDALVATYGDPTITEVLTLAELLASVPAPERDA